MRGDLSPWLRLLRLRRARLTCPLTVRRSLSLRSLRRDILRSLEEMFNLCGWPHSLLALLIVWILHVIRMRMHWIPAERELDYSLQGELVREWKECVSPLLHRMHVRVRIRLGVSIGGRVPRGVGLSLGSPSLSSWLGSSLRGSCLRGLLSRHSTRRSSRVHLQGTTWGTVGEASKST